jgi:hypothetical protein
MIIIPMISPRIRTSVCRRFHHPPRLNAMCRAARYHERRQGRLLQLVSRSCAYTGLPCLRRCVHGAPIGAARGPAPARRRPPAGVSTRLMIEASWLRSTSQCQQFRHPPPLNNDCHVVWRDRQLQRQRPRSTRSAGQEREDVSAGESAPASRRRRWAAEVSVLIAGRPAQLTKRPFAPLN